MIYIESIPECPPPESACSTNVEKLLKQDLKLLWLLFSQGLVDELALDSESHPNLFTKSSFMRYVQSISEACTIKTYWSDSHEAYS